MASRDDVKTQVNVTNLTTLVSATKDWLRDTFGRFVGRTQQRLIRRRDGPSKDSSGDGTDPAKTRPEMTPRALDISEIPGIVADYKTAAENAIAAGFDGVEVHAANGYLLEEFLCDGVNKRTDAYGGSIENRARIIFEVVEAVLSSVPSSHVGIRLSPFGDTFGCKDSTPRETYGYVVNKLNDYDLAYLHVIERRGRHADSVDAPVGGVAHHFRGIYNGVIIAAAGFDRADAIKTIEEGSTDLVAFGRYFISNPDLVERLRVNAELTPFDSGTFYMQPDMPVQAGYTDYPFLGEEDNGIRSAGYTRGV
ncbi:hypothetical protein ON010_g9263 [Phytophthora cinnamomi]|nr:hypothetical protein ON010_g9263 [Phytophthora cinnamomi]